jgi:hypothetical protein
LEKIRFASSMTEELPNRTPRRMSQPAVRPITIRRHGLIVRLTHWVNAATWVFLLMSGLRRMAAKIVILLGSSWALGLLKSGSLSSPLWVSLDQPNRHTRLFMAVTL